MEPIFSVVVPVYKVEKYLDQCVNSILNQTCADFELILVDDGSPDRCPEMCDEYARKDSRVKVVHKANGGLVSARKAGVAVASGQYIVTVDSDDWIAEELLQRIKEAIAYSGSDVICFNYYKADNEQTEQKNGYPEGVYTTTKLESVRKKFLYDPELHGLNNGSLPNSICTKAVRMGLYYECQQKVPDDITKGEDLLFTLHMLAHCQSLHMLDFLGYYYRVNPDSMTHKWDDMEFERLHRLTELILVADTEKSELYINKAYAYAVDKFLDLAFSIGRQMKSIRNFVSVMDNNFNPDFERYFKGVRLKTASINDYAKIFLVKNQLWSILYICISVAKLKHRI